MAIVTELITRFGFEGSTQELERYNSRLGKGVAILGAFTIAAGATAGALSAWVSSVLAGEQPLIDLADQTGVAIERIQELQFAASVSNSSAEALSSSLSELNKRMGEIANEKGPAEEFKKLGLSVRDATGQMKSADRLLEELGYRFQELGLSTAEQQFFADALGIDRSLLSLMRKSKEEMSAMSQEARNLGILTKEQTKDAADYNDSLTTLKFGLDGLRRLAAVGLAPELKKLADSFTKLIIENKDWIVNGIKATIKIIIDFAKMLQRLWPVLAAGAAAFGVITLATRGWAGALALLGKVPIIAAITGIAIVIDDLIVGFRGGKSVIFEFTAALRLMVTDAIEWAAKKMDAFIATVKGLTEAVQEFFGIDTRPEAIIEEERRIKHLYDAVEFGNITSEQADMAIKSGVSVGALYEENDSPLAGEGPSDAVWNIRNAGVTRGAGANNTINQNIKMEIKTTDPERAGTVVKDRLQEHLQDAQYQTRRAGEQ
jgi:hypothetical protein